MLVTFSVVALNGCGGSSEDRLDVKRLEMSFKSADPAVKARIDKVVTVIKAGDYKVATDSLNQLLKEQKLEVEQLSAVKAVIYQMSLQQPTLNSAKNLP